MMWLNAKGQIQSVFPDDLLETDRPAAMGVALLSLGERVSQELAGGALRYSLIAGEAGLHLLIRLDKDNLLMCGLHPQMAIDRVLDAVRLNSGDT